MLVRYRAGDSAIDGREYTRCVELYLLAVLINLIVYQPLSGLVSALRAVYAQMTYRVTGDDNLWCVLCGDTVHALQPASPLLRVHPGENDVTRVFAVLPTLRDVFYLLGNLRELFWRGGNDDDKWFVNGIHDLLERVRIKFDCGRQTIAQELCTNN